MKTIWKKYPNEDPEPTLRELKEHELFMQDGGTIGLPIRILRYEKERNLLWLVNYIWSNNKYQNMQLKEGDLWCCESDLIASIEAENQPQGDSELIQAAKNILHLHLCEQEGISSGQPTRKQWLKAVDDLSDALTSKPLKGEDNE